MESGEKNTICIIKDYKNNKVFQVDEVKADWKDFRVDLGENAKEIVKNPDSEWIAMKNQNGEMVSLCGEDCFKWKLIFTGKDSNTDSGLSDGVDYVVLQCVHGRNLSCDLEYNLIPDLNEFISDEQKWKYQFCRKTISGESKLGLCLIAPNGKYLTFNFSEMRAERSYPGEFEIFYSPFN